MIETLYDMPYIIYNLLSWNRSIINLNIRLNYLVHINIGLY